MANGTTTARDVDILFAGLFFFAFKNKDLGDPEKYEEGQVAIFKTAPEHHLCLQLNDQFNFQIYQESFPLLPPIVEIERTPSVTSGVRVHGGWDRPRDNPPADPTRFGYILDFESDDLHGRQHPNGTGKHTNNIFSVLRFKTGVFDTRKLGERLKAENGAATVLLGQVAEVIGVKVGLAAGQDLVFRAGSLSYTLPSTVTKVLISNTCPDDPPANGRIDMEEHYSLVDVPVREQFRYKPSTILEANPFVCYSGGGSKTNGLL
jgi:hypothetical protein